MITIVRDYVSDMKIVIAKNAIPSEKYAAEELRRWLFASTGTALPIIDDEGNYESKEFILGENKHSRQAGVSITNANLGADGYVLRTVGDSIAIVGGKPRGTLYGVYAFLEDYLGIRWFAQDCTHVPKRCCLSVGDIDERYKPRLNFREANYSDAFTDPDFTARLRMNGSLCNATEKHGGRIKYAQPWVHTFFYFCKPEDYFAEHPEYFSYYDGERHDGHTQFCLTNDGLFEVVLTKLRKWIEENPDCTVFSISQNDWFNRCQCEKCSAIEEEEGSPMGPLLRFINRIAEAIEPEFPNIFIDTLAYRYTRKPPKLTKPRKNVIIRLCSFECCFYHDLGNDSCETNSAFKEDTKGWGKICDNVFVWDYVVNFPHIVMPFSNLFSLRENVRYFIDNGVKNLFEETCWYENAEFEPLKTYLLGRFMWNPDSDVDLSINEFLAAYYKTAAPFIRRYIDLLYKRYADIPNYHCGIYTLPTPEVFTDQLLTDAEEMFDKAYKAADDSIIRHRVEIAAMQVKYLRLYFTEWNSEGYAEKVDRFFTEADRLGVRHVHSWNDNEIGKKRFLNNQYNTVHPPTGDPSLL
ncbi:MAG: DUF4838 domain-containing protein [Treponema sp.]|jgi:hypothetical protein|nr:DUF4838 domain-containing protein [Treponema sp.]